MTTSKVARLAIQDVEIAVNLMVEGAPNNMMLRELIQNGIEAPRSPHERKRIIRIENDQGKLVIINSGGGMTADQLCLVTDLSSSLGKQKGTKVNKNRGEGGKIASLKFNPQGMRYRSRTEEGIAQCTLSFDGEGWGRELVSFDNNEESESFYLDEQTDVTPAEASRYAAFGSRDFTEVKLMGLTPQHCTAYDPYGIADAGTLTDDLTKNTVPNDLFNRYYRLPDIGFPIDIRFSSGFGAGSRVAFRTVSDLIENHPTEFIGVDNRFVELKDGTRIEYVMHTQQHGKGRTPWAMHSPASNRNRCAIVYGNEMYDVIDVNWRREAVHFGMFGVSNCVSVFIHLPTSRDLGDGRYRELLKSEKGQTITTRDFAGAVLAHRPKWLLDQIAMVTQQDNIGDNDKVLERLNKFVTTIATKRVPESNVVPFPTGEKKERTRTGAPNQRRNAGSPPRGTEASEDGRGRSKLVPEFKWVSDPTEVMPSLVARGAEYVESGNILYINGAYPMFNRIVDDVRAKMTAKQPISDIETLDTVIRAKVVDQVKYKIGMAVCLILAKKRSTGWHTAHIQQSLSLESLTTAYDLTIADVGEIQRLIGFNDTYKSLVATQNAGSEIAPDNDLVDAESDDLIVIGG